MITDKELHRLAAYEPKESPVVSVYLNVDPTQRTTEGYKLRLRGLIKENVQPDIAADLEAIERYFEHEYDWGGKSAVVFSSQAAGYWETYSLGVPIGQSRLAVGPRPMIQPLVHLLDLYGSYAVVLVDQQGGRLFDFHMGHLVETEGHLGEEVRRLKRGSGSSRGGASRSGGGGGSRHDRETAVQNLRDTADATNRFFEQQGMKHLLIAGTDETVARFRDLLPKALQSAVVGTFPLNMNASHGEVLERSLEIVRQADQERELRLVNTVITAAAKGGNGVIRLDDTLSAVSEGRVQTLVVSAGYHAPGYRCQSCSYLTAQALAGCPFCGGSIHEIPDAVELAIQRAMQQGIEVEIVEKKDQLDAAGGIGALLRY